MYSHTLPFNLHLLQADDQGPNQLELARPYQAEAGQVLNCSLLGKAWSQDEHLVLVFMQSDFHGEG